MARRTQSAPLLQLFNGYRRSQSTRGAATIIKWQSRTASWTGYTSSPCAARRDLQRNPRQLFSTTASQALRNRPARVARKDESPEGSPSKLEPAQTIASHTEGLQSEGEEGGAVTWRDYDPAGGMPLPGGDRSQTQINAIFQGEDVDKDTGNYILSVMHWRRMSGALIDVGIEFPKDSGVTSEQALRGLKYVRTLAPNFDEQGAGETWVEEESQRLQDQIQERSIKLGLYKRDEVEAEGEEEIDQGTEYGRARNTESALQRLREENKAISEKEEAEKQASQDKSDLAALHSSRGPLELAGGVQPTLAMTTYTTPSGIDISRPQTKAWLQPVYRKPWVKYYEDQATIIKEHSIPQLSLLQRLGPSFLVLLLVLSAAAFLAENYTPPPTSARIWPHTSPGVATLAALTALVATSFILSRLPPLWRTFSKYFALVPAYPYAFSLLGCQFRHDTLSHLLTNTSALWLFGLLLHDQVGRGTFLSIYFASGTVGAFTALCYNVLNKHWMTYMFGSSGCVLGVVAAVCTLKPHGQLRVAGYDVPVAAWMFFLMYGVSTVVGVRMGLRGIDHAGHIGGVVTGFAAALWDRLHAWEDESVMKEVVAAEHGDGENLNAPLSSEVE